MSKTIATTVFDPDEQVKLFILDRFGESDSSGRWSDFAGVYLICMTKHLGFRGNRPRISPEIVMYAGSSMNIRRRLKSPDHPLNVLQEQHDHLTRVYARSLECADYLNREIQLIKLFRPPMNIQHNA